MAFEHFFSSSLPTFLTVLGHFWPKHRRFLGYLETRMGPFWDSSGPFLGQFGAILGSLRDQFGIVSGSISPLLGGSFWPHLPIFEPFLGHFFARFPVFLRSFCSYFFFWWCLGGFNAKLNKVVQVKVNIYANVWQNSQNLCKNVQKQAPFSP